MMPPLPPVAAGTWNSVMAAPAVKVLAATEPVPKDGAESVPRIVAVTEDGVPIEYDWPVVSAAIALACTVSVSSPSATPSLWISMARTEALPLLIVRLKPTKITSLAFNVLPFACLKSAVFLALPETLKLTARVPLVMGGEVVMVNVTVSPSSTCKPGQVVSRSPPVPQLAGVPAQLPLAAMVTVCAATGMAANAARTKAATLAPPPEIREQQLR